MARHYKDWIQTFLEYSKFGEAPPHMYFWVAVSAIAGALRKHVWFDMGTFRWYPNFYIIIVAPPGIVAKSTTSGVGMELLRAVPGIKFGPNVVTWEALVQKFGQAAEQFEWNGEMRTMSPITIESSEFGNLFDPKDRKMVDVFVDLWDSKDGPFEKATKMSGNDHIVSPWFNIIGCTTPSWIAENFSRYLIGGGFTSRAMFVYAQQKHKFVAYPKRHMTEEGYDREVVRQKLIEDLEHISCNLIGEYEMTEEAYEFGEAWYTDHYTKQIRNFDPTVFGGYVARKQSHVHKLAMVLAAATSDEMLITKTHLETALQMVTDLEPDMHHVFTQIGKSDAAVNIDKLFALVKRLGKVSYADAYKEVHSYFPSAREFEDVLLGAQRSGFVVIKSEGGRAIIYPGPAMP